MGMAVRAGLQQMAGFDNLWDSLGAESIVPKAVNLSSLRTRAMQLVERAPGFSDAERTILTRAMRQLTIDGEYSSSD